MIPPVVASDRGRAQTACVAMHARGSRTEPMELDMASRTLWKVGPQQVTVLYAKLSAAMRYPE